MGTDSTSQLSGRCRGGSAATIRAVVACVAIATLASCGSRPQPASTVAPAVAEATREATDRVASQAALVAYQGYLSTYVRAAATADWSGTGIDRFTADPLRQQLHAALRTWWRAGIVLRGRPLSNPGVASVDTLGGPQTASIHDCFDTSGWQPVYRASGDSAAAPGQATRYPVAALAERYPDGSWYIQQINASRGVPC